MSYDPDFDLLGEETDIPPQPGGIFFSKMM